MERGDYLEAARAQKRAQGPIINKIEGKKPIGNLNTEFEVKGPLNQ